MLTCGRLQGLVAFHLDRLRLRVTYEPTVYFSYVAAVPRNVVTAMDSWSPALDPFGISTCSLSMPDARLVMVAWFCGGSGVPSWALKVTVDKGELSTFKKSRSCRS